MRLIFVLDICIFRVLNAVERKIN